MRVFLVGAEVGQIAGDDDGVDRRRDCDEHRDGLAQVGGGIDLA